MHLSDTGEHLFKTKALVKKKWVHDLPTVLEIGVWPATALALRSWSEFHWAQIRALPPLFGGPRVKVTFVTVLLLEETALMALLFV
ncbi:Vacuolar Protein Sorting-Associated Protein 37C [Manis pentadactyla]|nr:Vacuolar Protein Sorting-Associated Protein 37C [Manis pentadactyla]